MEATKNDSPHGSGEASDVMYGDDSLLHLILNNFRPIVNIFNGIFFYVSLALKMKSYHHSAMNEKTMIFYMLIKHIH